MENTSRICCLEKNSKAVIETANPAGVHTTMQQRD